MRIGPHLGSRRAPTTSSRPGGAMASTSMPSRTKIRLRLADIGRDTVPGSQQRRVVGDVEDDAAGVALMRQRGGLRLQDDGIADPLCDLARLVGIARQCAFRDGDAERRQQRLALILGQRCQSAAIR